jgi:hypothetical protein
MQGIALALIHPVRHTPIAGAQTQPILSLMPGSRQSADDGSRGAVSPEDPDGKLPPFQCLKRLSHQLLHLCPALRFGNLVSRAICRMVAGFGELFSPKLRV